jgi:7-cyano-7-deazaguanine synthase
MKVVVLCSGGMDSTVALYEARQRHEVLAGLSCDYGSKHNHREIPLAADHCRRLGIPHKVIDLGFIGTLFSSSLLCAGGDIPEGHYEEENMRQTVVPFRNGILLSAAAGLAESIGAEGLVIGAHAGDHAIYPDCREEFMAAMSEAIAKGTYAGIRILRPLISIDKAQIARLGTELGVDFGQTWSCYKGGEIHCGVCGTCVERREAFAIAGIPDPVPYLKTGPLPAAPGRKT